MEQHRLNSKQLQGLLKLDPWAQYVPLPRILDLMIQVLRKDDNADVPREILENLLPHLCFALPPVAQNCTKLLNTLPENSSVWNKLEEGLKDGKHLPVEIIAVLYERYPSALEREMFSILKQYGEKVVDEDQSQKALQKLAEQNLYSKSSNSWTDLSKQSVSNEENSHSDYNFWSENKVILAAAFSASVFKTCFCILCKLCIDTKFSVSSAIASQDFLSAVRLHLSGELYEYFDSGFQHIVYLLTMPPAYLDVSEHSITIENSLKEMVHEGVDCSTLQCLLCFFPEWIPLLTKREFFNENLRICECFSNFGMQI